MGELELERLKKLTKWKRYAWYIVEAVKRLYPKSRVYLIGSVAEGTYTSSSDIDILVIIPEGPKPVELSKIRFKLWEEAARLGIPWDNPINLLVVVEPQAKEFLSRTRRFIKLWPD